MRGNPTQKNGMQCNAAWCCVAKTEHPRHKGDFLFRNKRNSYVHLGWHHFSSFASLSCCYHCLGKLILIIMVAELKKFSFHLQVQKKTSLPGCETRENACENHHIRLNNTIFRSADPLYL